MSTSKWFERKFDFNLPDDDLNTIISRLEQLPSILQQLVKDIPNNKLSYQPGGKWSIKEQVGHLCVLEQLWQDRIIDFKTGKKQLTPADLDNKATREGKFNNWKMPDLVKRFSTERQKTLQMLSDMAIEDRARQSLHPRLNQQMRLIDHLYFVAEHDDHHLEKIREILGA
jgi:uncharacterized damage-inducible protein DinB